MMDGPHKRMSDATTPARPTVPECLTELEKQLELLNEVIGETVDRFEAVLRPETPEEVASDGNTSDRSSLSAIQYRIRRAVDNVSNQRERLYQLNRRSDL